MIPGGGQISDVRLQPNFLHFHAVFRKILPNNRLAPHPLWEVLDSIEKKIYVVKFGSIYNFILSIVEHKRWLQTADEQISGISLRCLQPALPDHCTGSIKLRSMSSHSHVGNRSPEFATSFFSK